MRRAKTTLWKPIESVPKMTGVSRATLYRWKQQKRIKTRIENGLVEVDVYQVRSESLQPRRSAGRKLAIQKTKQENFRSKSPREKTNWFTTLGRLVERVVRESDHSNCNEWSANDRLAFLQRVQPILDLAAKVRGEHAPAGARSQRAA